MNQAELDARVVELSEQMRAAQRAALKRQRDAFQAKWGSFWKCEKCGARLGGVTDILVGTTFRRATDARCACGGAVKFVGYAPPPKD